MDRAIQLAKLLALFAFPQSLQSCVLAVLGASPGSHITLSVMSSLSLVICDSFLAFPCLS